MGIEPTRTGCRPSPVLKTGAPTRNAYASLPADGQAASLEAD